MLHVGDGDDGDVDKMIVALGIQRPSSAHGRVHILACIRTGTLICTGVCARMRTQVSVCVCAVYGASSAYAYVSSSSYPYLYVYTFAYSLL